MSKLEDRVSKCPSCGANVTGNFCEYCGTRFAPDDDSKVVIINNYYGNANGASASRADSWASGPTASSDAAGASQKSRFVALVLAVILGYFGAHRFYAGQILSGLVYLFTFGVFGIGWVVDIIRIAIGVYRDNQGRVISNW